MRHPIYALRALPAVACALLAACAPIERHFVRDDAVQRFSTTVSCPVDRLVVKQLALDPASLFDRPPPPPDVAADPGRRRVWDDETARAYAGWPGLSAIDVAGCGARTTYACWFEAETDSTLSPYCIDADRLAEAHWTHGLQLRPDALASIRQRLDAMR
jgi:hypothetical protein